jgi:hypothetical protein
MVRLAKRLVRMGLSCNRARDILAFKSKELNQELMAVPLSQLIQAGAIFPQAIKHG